MSPMGTAAIAVCIPVKDRLESLRLALASVYAQTVLPREIIVVDDASEVHVSAAALPSAPAHVTLRVIRNETNLGGGQSRNRAVAAASQPVIAFLDSDDLLMPRYMEAVSAAWATEDAFAALAVSFFWCTENMTPYRVQRAHALTSRRNLLLNGNSVGGCSVLSVERDRFAEIGGFTSSRGVDDWDLLLRLAKSGPIAAIEEPLVLYKAPALGGGESMTFRHGRQILALTSLLKRLPPTDAALAGGVIKLLVAKHLAGAGRGRAAFRLLISSLQASLRLRSLHVQIAATILIGPARVARLISFWAQHRARRETAYNTSHENSVLKYIEQLQRMSRQVEAPDIHAAERRNP
jgi:GT2 family glycosyltransferase